MVGRLAVLIALLATGILAQGPSWSSVSADYLTHSTARIIATASTASTAFHVEYDPVATTPPFAYSTIRKTSSARTYWEFLVGALTPATTYNYRVCATANATEACSAVAQFTTAGAPGNRLALPVALPVSATIAAEPSSYGSTFTLGSNCSGVQNCFDLAAAITGTQDIAVVIPYGTTYNGGFVLPARGCSTCGWIVVKTSATAAQLPPPGVRITPAYQSMLPVLNSVSPGATSLSAAIRTDVTQKWRFIGIAISNTPAAPGTSYFTLVNLTSNSADIVFDRCMFMSTDSAKAGIRTAGPRTAAVSSYFELYRQDANMQLAVDFTGSTGLLLENNYFDAPGITVFSQGGVGVPSNLTQNSTIRRNHFKWNDAYRNIMYTRQQLEFKQGATALIEGNTFADQWTGGAVGSYNPVVALTPRSDDGGVVPVDTNIISDLTFRYNTFRHVCGLFQLLGSNTADQALESKGMKRILIEHNLAYNIDGFYAKTGNSAGGPMHAVAGAIEDLVVRKNTYFDPRGARPYIFRWNDAPGSGLVAEDNLFGWNDGPISGMENAFSNHNDFSGLLPAFTDASSTAALAQAVPFNRFLGNVIVPGLTGIAWDDTDPFRASYYANAAKHLSTATCVTHWSGVPGQICAGGSATTADAAYDEVKLASRSRNDYRLRYDSPYRGKGADITAMSVAQGWVFGPVKARYASGKPTVLRYETRDVAMQCYLQLDGGSWQADTPGARFREFSVTGGAAGYVLACAGGSKPMDQSGEPAVFSGTVQ